MGTGRFGLPKCCCLPLIPGFCQIHHHQWYYSLHDLVLHLKLTRKHVLQCSLDFPWNAKKNNDKYIVKPRFFHSTILAFKLNEFHRFSSPSNLRWTIMGWWVVLSSDDFLSSNQTQHPYIPTCSVKEMDGYTSARSNLLILPACLPVWIMNIPSFISSGGVETAISSNTDRTFIARWSSA